MPPKKCFLMKIQKRQINFTMSGCHGNGSDTTLLRNMKTCNHAQKQHFCAQDKQGSWYKTEKHEKLHAYIGNNPPERQQMQLRKKHMSRSITTTAFFKLQHCLLVEN